MPNKKPNFYLLNNLTLKDFFVQKIKQLTILCKYKIHVEKYAWTHLLENKIN